MAIGCRDFSPIKTGTRACGLGLASARQQCHHGVVGDMQNRRSPVVCIVGSIGLFLRSPKLWITMGITMGASPLGSCLARYLEWTHSPLVPLFGEAGKMPCCGLNTVSGDQLRKPFLSIAKAMDKKDALRRIHIPHPFKQRGCAAFFEAAGMRLPIYFSRPSAFKAACTAGRAPMRAEKACNCVNALRSTPTYFAQDAATNK